MNGKFPEQLVLTIRCLFNQGETDSEANIIECKLLPIN
jgi:hypothetical protein